MRKLTVITLLLLALDSYAQRVDFSVVFVPEESGNNITRISSAGDYVCLPLVNRSTTGVKWYSNRILGISPDGTQLAYISNRNNATNIFITDLSKQGGSVQRTNRQGVQDFSFSSDGKYICFSEVRGKECQLFQTDAKSGYVCRQITSGARDYSPVYSSDMKQIFFAREERKGFSVWSYNIANNFLATYSPGLNPSPVQGESSYFCTRISATGNCEIWKVNYETGLEECIVSDPNRSFAAPTISPDGKWLLMVGGSVIESGSVRYWNTDLYACYVDGSNMTQLTYHAADDLSPVWSADGKKIYFISQRGDAEGTANIWCMDFNY
ncbi:MAG: PD40 domain-containing protein [Bacteroidaceae bacterium]|nr:PD40 domain-containing protein [Bacteroidaceae bacterium]